MATWSIEFLDGSTAQVEGSSWETAGAAGSSELLRFYSEPNFSGRTVAIINFSTVKAIYRHKDD